MRSRQRQIVGHGCRYETRDRVELTDPGAIRATFRTRIHPVDMCSTCEYVQSMPRMIQIRNVPNELHRQLKARAALEGMTLSDYLLREVSRVAARPSPSELQARLAERPAVRPRVSPARAVRAERDQR